MEDVTGAFTWYSEELGLQYPIIAFFAWNFCYEINVV